ncbi:MAG: enoyl-CoA hydratase/isomerase family protein [Ilumatobacteraceae bacterium]
MTSTRKLRYSVNDGVAHIVLDRPERLNALDFGPGSLRAQVLEALAEADRNDAVGAIVIRGAGRAFCAGGDLDLVVEGTASRPPTIDDERRFMEMVADFDERVRRTSTPIIAAVHGLCLGTAVSFVAQCDFVVAAQDARFGLIEGRIGHPGVTELVPIVGVAWAKFLILTGEIIDARLAQQIGLVLAVVDPDQLVDRVSDLAGRIARMPREAVIMNKATVNAIADAGGRATGRITGLPHEVITRTASWLATAPDGRRFADILRDSGIEEMKRARDQQYRDPWLRPSDT